MKIILLFITIAVISLSIFTTYETRIQEPNLDKELKQIATKNYLEIKIVNALNNDNIDDAIMYKDLANYLHININKKIINKINQSNTLLANSLRNSKEFANGFIYGKSTSSVGLAGSITSDMTLVGDIRDMYNEGSKMVNNKDYDKLTLGVATIGLGLGAVNLATAGATAPLKIGSSIIKVAKKTNKLSKSFLKIIISKISKTIDFKLFKKVDFTSIKKMKKTYTIVIKRLKLKNIKLLFNNISKIGKNTSKIDSIKLMKYVKNEKDLSKIVKLSNKYKKNTLAVFKILGKGALKSGKIVIKYTTLLISQLIALTLSLIGFIILVISKYYLFNKIKKSVIT